MIKKIIISHELFNGFQVDLDLNNFDSVKSVIEFVSDKLEAYLIILNLEQLRKKAKSSSSSWHFHNNNSIVKFIDELRCISENKIYMCSH